MLKLLGFGFVILIVLASIYFLIPKDFMKPKSEDLPNRQEVVINPETSQPSPTLLPTTPEDDLTALEKDLNDLTIEETSFSQELDNL